MTAWTADQLANGDAMRRLTADQPRKVQECVFCAGLAECSYSSTQMGTGDISSATGQQSTSLGWFQQTAAWGSRADRLDLAASLQLFLHGGPDGQRGLLDLNWQDDSLTVADLCQMVQGSQFDGKTNWPVQGVLPWAKNYQDAYPAAVEMLDHTEGQNMGIRMLTDLADIGRAAGLEVIELDGWKERTSTDGSFDPIGVLLHHDAMGLGQNSDPNDDLNVPLNMIRPGEGGSQVWLGKRGEMVCMGAGRMPHAGKGIGWGRIGRDQGNTKMIGIETDYSGTGPWPEALLRSIDVLSKALVDNYGFDPADCCGHREYTRDTGRKVDPANFDLDAWRAKLASRTSQPAGNGGATPPIPTPPTDWFDDMATPAELTAAVKAGRPVDVYITYIREANGQVGIWECNVISGTRYHLATPKAVDGRRTVLTRAGFIVKDWGDAAHPVDNPAAFGRVVA